MNTMKRKVLAGIAGVAVLGPVGGFAATLGGLTVEGLGASSNAVASCDTTGVDLAFTTAYDSTANDYDVQSVTVSNIDVACNGQDMKVTLNGSTASLTSEGAGTVGTTGTETLTLDAPIEAEAVDNAAVVISGTSVPV